MTAVVVLAKAPEPGRVKTRLCPPCTPDEAAALAEAALRDTLDAVAASGAGRRVVALDGEPGPWLPAGFEVLPQRGCGLDRRIASAFVDVAAPSLLIGMDTPQLTPVALDAVLAHGLDDGRCDAVLGPTVDGGYWAVGLARPDPRAFVGVPMSTARTYGHQLRRLVGLGLRPCRLPTLRDVDRYDDAIAVAGRAPATRFASRFRELATVAAP